MLATFLAMTLAQTDPETVRAQLAIAVAVQQAKYKPSEDASVPMPDEWVTPEWFTPYKRAKVTQRIAVTDGRDTITRVLRVSQEEKWRVPGGLVGLRGWRSDLYKWASGTVWIGDIPVLNSMGYFQNNRGWRRSYDEGSEFLDVLTNTGTGKVFEVRKAVKSGGAWQRFVVFRDKAQRPAGYAGHASLDCRGCHSQAGTGGYATGLVPGGDTVFSDPLLDEPEESSQPLPPPTWNMIDAQGRTRMQQSC